MVRVGVLGATGYTALELLKILLCHKEVEITALTSRQEGSPHIGMVHPQLFGRLDLVLENAEPAVVAAKSDCMAYRHPLFLNYWMLEYGSLTLVPTIVLTMYKSILNGTELTIRIRNVLAQWRMVCLNSSPTTSLYPS